MNFSKAYRHEMTSDPIAYIFVLLMFSFIFGPHIADKPIGAIWNRITPVKNHATLIETDICHAICIIVSVPLLIILLGFIKPEDFYFLTLLVAIAALPAALFGYMMQRYIHALSGKPELAKRSDMPHLDAPIPWRKIFAPIAAAATYIIALAGIFGGIIAIRILSQINPADGVSTISALKDSYDALLMFGAFVGVAFAIGIFCFISIIGHWSTQFGHNLRKRIKPHSDIQGENGLNYAVGMTAIQGIIISLSLLCFPGCGIETAVWSLWVTFGLIVISITLAAGIYDLIMGNETVVVLETNPPIDSKPAPSAL